MPFSYSIVFQLYGGGNTHTFWNPFKFVSQTIFFPNFCTFPLYSKQAIEKVMITHTKNNSIQEHLFLSTERWRHSCTFLLCFREIFWFPVNSQHESLTLTFFWYENRSFFSKLHHFHSFSIVENKLSFTQWSCKFSQHWNFFIFFDLICLFTLRHLYFFKLVTYFFYFSFTPVLDPSHSIVHLIVISAKNRIVSGWSSSSAVRLPWRQSRRWWWWLSDA